MHLLPSPKSARDGSSWRVLVTSPCDGVIRITLSLRWLRALSVLDTYIDREKTPKKSGSKNYF